MGDDGVSKRLDIFLIIERLANIVVKFRSWVVNLGIYNHYPICLQFDGDLVKLKYPYKFNRCWLEEEDFLYLVKENWNTLEIPYGAFAMDRMMENLRKLKRLVGQWEKEKKHSLIEELMEVEEIWKGFMKKTCLEYC